MKCNIYILIILIIIVITIISVSIHLITYYYNETIPKTIYLCHKTKDIPSYVLTNLATLNPNYKIFLYDNTDCTKFLYKYFGQKYVDCFNYIKEGPIKADFWRVCILYIFGGVYCDIDVEMLVPIKDLLQPGVKFLTCISMTLNKLNPHLIITIKNNKILKECIDKYIDYYDMRIKYTYNTWSIIEIMGPIIFKQFNKYINMDGIYVSLDGTKYQFIKEIFRYKLHNVYCSYKNKPILNNRYKEYNANEHIFK